MRVAAPVLGPAFLMEGRVFFAASFLLVLALVLKKRHEIFKHWKHFFIMGLFNCALPWYLFGQAALKLTTAQLSIINALAPLFAFVIGLVMRTDKLESKRAIGLLLGILGVAVLFGNLDSTGGAADIASVLMATGASFAYGIATSYTKAVKGLEPFHNALGSLWMASFILLPTLFFVPIRGVVTTTVVLATLAIGIVCSGIDLFAQHSRDGLRATLVGDDVKLGAVVCLQDACYKMGCAARTGGCPVKAVAFFRGFNEFL